MFYSRSETELQCSFKPENPNDLKAPGNYTFDCLPIKISASSGVGRQRYDYSKLLTIARTKSFLQVCSVESESRRNSPSD